MFRHRMLKFHFSYFSGVKIFKNSKNVKVRKPNSLTGNHDQRSTDENRLVQEKIET